MAKAATPKLRGGYTVVDRGAEHEGTDQRYIVLVDQGCRTESIFASDSLAVVVRLYGVAR